MEKITTKRQLISRIKKIQKEYSEFTNNQISELKEILENCNHDYTYDKEVFVRSSVWDVYTDILYDEFDSSRLLKKGKYKEGDFLTAEAEKKYNTYTIVKP